VRCKIGATKVSDDILVKKVMLTYYAAVPAS